MVTYDQRTQDLAAGMASAMIYGEVEWRAMNGGWRTTFEVDADGFHSGELTLQMRLQPRRLDQPTVLLMNHAPAGGGGTMCIRRVDVNGGHAGRYCTHIQGQPPENFLQWIESNTVFSQVVPNSVPSGPLLERVFRAACDEFQVMCAGVEWFDPPEGRPEDD